MYKPAVILFALALFLTSCTGPATDSDDVLRLGITPNLATLQPAIYACAADIPGHVQVEALPLKDMTYGEYAAVIHAGQSPQASVLSTRVGNLEIQIIVNPENPVTQMDADDLAKILLGIQTDWQVVAPQSFTKPTPIHVWSYPAGDDIRGVVEGYFLEGRFMTATSQLAPDSQAMQAAILGDPAAIGFIVGDIHLSTSSNTQPDPRVVYTLEEPILASFGSTPDGTLKELIVCLSKPGE